MKFQAQATSESLVAFREPKSRPIPAPRLHRNRLSQPRTSQHWQDEATEAARPRSSKETGTAFESILREGPVSHKGTVITCSDSSEASVTHHPFALAKTSGTPLAHGSAPSTGQCRKGRDSFTPQDPSFPEGSVMSKNQAQSELYRAGSSEGDALREKPKAQGTGGGAGGGAFKGSQVPGLRSGTGEARKGGEGPGRKGSLGASEGGIAKKGSLESRGSIESQGDSKQSEGYKALKGLSAGEAFAHFKSGKSSSFSPPSNCPSPNWTGRSSTAP